MLTVFSKVFTASGKSFLALAILLAAAVFLADTSLAHAAETDAFGAAFGKESSSTVCGVACALKGTIGWIIIGFGMILALWDYFVQKQGNLIIIAIIGVVAVVIVGRAMYAGAGCEAAGLKCKSTAELQKVNP